MKTCGVLFSAKVKKQPVVAEFASFQDTIVFHKRGRFGLKKVQNSEIHIKVVLDMEYGNWIGYNNLDKKDKDML